MRVLTDLDLGGASLLDNTLPYPLHADTYWIVE